MGFSFGAGPPRISGVATIPISTTTSTIIDTQHYPYLGLYLPASMTGTALSFLVADDDGDTFVVLRNEAGVAVSITINAAGGLQVLSDNAVEIAVARYLKLVSGSSEAAARTIPWVAFAS